MSRYRDSNPDCKIYIGDLGSSANKQDLEDAFSYYGPIRSVWIARNPPGFAFVEFDDARDAEDAVRGLDGRNVCGRRVRVEMSNGARRRGSGGGGGGGGGRRGRPFHPEDKCYECGERGHYARDCSRYSSKRGGGGGGGGGGRRRSYSRSRSRSRSRDRRSRDRSRSRSRSRSRGARSRSREREADSRDRNGN